MLIFSVVELSFLSICAGEVVSLILSSAAFPWSACVGTRTVVTYFALWMLTHGRRARAGGQGPVPISTRTFIKRLLPNIVTA